MPAAVPRLSHGRSHEPNRLGTSFVAGARDGAITFIYMRNSGRAAVFCLCMLAAVPCPVSSGPRPYALSKWNTESCRAKGRFQDREYCSSSVMDRIVADGKDAIPVLISQITDTREIAEPVYDYWPRITTGELAYFILTDLFLDDTWQKSTMPDLFPLQPCNDAAWVCWAKFRKAHSMKDLQSRWRQFWVSNQNRIYWDERARCFRLRPEAKGRQN